MRSSNGCSRINEQEPRGGAVSVPLPPAPRRKDLCCAEAELNEIEEEFFLFCSFSFSVFTQIPAKLNLKDDKGSAAARGGLRRPLMCCYSAADRLLPHIYLINPEEDCC